MIEIKKLCKNYPGKIVLKDASAVIADGETFSVIGPSGTGKSTLLKCIIRLVNPESGSIIVDGRDITGIHDEIELARIRKDFGYLFQEGALFDSLSIMENVTFGLKYLTDIPKSEYSRIALEKLALVGLKDVESLKPSEISGGMKKRAALARAIAAGPKYILYDEPTAGLDPVTAEMVLELIRDMAAKLKVTSIIVTHDIRLAFTISTRIAVLAGGAFEIVDTPEKLRQSDHPLVMEFMEDSYCPGSREKKRKKAG